MLDATTRNIFVERLAAVTEINGFVMATK